MRPTLVSDLHLSLPWFVMEFVEGGCRTVVFGGNEESLRAGDFFLYGPGIPHRIATDAEKPLLKYFVSFSGIEAAALLSDRELPLGKVLHCLQPEPIRRAFEALIDRGLIADCEIPNTPRRSAPRSPVSGEIAVQSTFQENAH